MNDKAGFKLRDVIEHDIAMGLLRPGERIDETSLAKRHGLSRTPVREALHQLAMAGMVEQRPHRGAFVVDVRADQLFAMFEVAAELEAFCGRLAARRITAEGRQELAVSLENCRAARDDADAYYRQNELFHQAIYDASGNAFLAGQCLALQKRLRPYRRLQLQVTNRVRDSFAEHERIVAMILAGDSESSSLELRNHVCVQGDRFADLVAGLSRLRAA